MEFLGDSVDTALDNLLEFTGKAFGSGADVLVERHCDECCLYALSHRSHLLWRSGVELPPALFTRHLSLSNEINVEQQKIVHIGLCYQTYVSFNRWVCFIINSVEYERGGCCQLSRNSFWETRTKSDDTCPIHASDRECKSRQLLNNSCPHCSLSWYLFACNKVTASQGRWMCEKPAQDVRLLSLVAPLQVSPVTKQTSTSNRIRALILGVRDFFSLRFLEKGHIQVGF